jgi:disease resistance protein RPM1
MHDLVRELAIKLSEKESFNSTYDDTPGVIEDVSDSRRVSVLRCNKDLKLNIDPCRLRTFLLFDTTMLYSSWSSLVPSKSKYLAVLDLSGLPIETIPHSIGELFNLKYLCLNDTNLKSLPKSVTRLNNLQTLSLERTQLSSFPRGFAKLKKLRHILVWKLLHTGSSSFNHSIGVGSANDNLWDLTELQTLDEVRASERFISNLENLVQLRSLYISDVRSKYCSQLCTSLSKLQHLLRLNVKACNQDEVLMLEALTLPPELQTLQLTGRLAEGVLKSPMFSAPGNTLVRLSLCWCHLTENPIPYLSKLSNLTSLQVKGAYDGQELGFHDGWFPKLKGMSLTDMEHITRIYIEKGALICLEYLKLDGLKELVSVPDGMEFLSSIQDVYFRSLHPRFRQNLQESVETGRLKHIPVMQFQ